MNKPRIDATLTNLLQYKNNENGAFSATTAGDDDIYNDDNAQAAWVFIDAYKATGNTDYLDNAKGIVNWVISQWASNGGVFWHLNNNYVASISTTEAALAAVRLYEIEQDNKLLEFASNCMDWMFANLQDKSDYLFYDGLNNDDYSDINKGKLTYSVGCGLSAMAYLHYYTGNQKWLIESKNIATSVTKGSGAFYGSDGAWNNQLQYVHLLFMGFADLFKYIPWQPEFDGYKTEVLKQGSYVYTTKQDPDDPNMYFNLPTTTPQMTKKYNALFNQDASSSDTAAQHCDSNENNPIPKSLMDNASAAQIMFAISQIESPQ